MKADGVLSTVFYIIMKFTIKINSLHFQITYSTLGNRDPFLKIFVLNSEFKDSGWLPMVVLLTIRFLA